MTKRPLSVRIPDEVRAHLESYADQTGSSMSDIVLEALAHYFSLSSPKSLHERVSQIEQQLKQIRALSSS